MKEGEEEPVFSTFKGLGYVSMIAGVPLTPLLILGATAALGGLILFALVDAWGLLLPVFCGIIYMGLRILCETDNKAMERAKWSFKAVKWRFRYGSKILTVSPNLRRSKHEHFFSRLKKIRRP